MDDATLMESFINDVLMAINIDGVNLANAAGPHLILSFNEGADDGGDEKKSQ